MRNTRFVIFSLLLLLPAIAAAQGTGQNQFVPLLPSLPGLADAANSNSFAPFLAQVYKICIGLAAVLAVLQLMRAGVMYMGGDSITEKKEARSLIAMSLVGLLLVLAPTIVFGIINPKILQLDINTTSLKTSITNIQGAAAPTAPATPAPGTSPSNPTPSTVDSTGQVNPACRLMPDGTVLNSSGGSQQNQDEQCCARQTVNGTACHAAWNYASTPNVYYCSCSGT